MFGWNAYIQLIFDQQHITSPSASTPLSVFRRDSSSSDCLFICVVSLICKLCMCLSTWIRKSIIPYSVRLCIFPHGNSSSKISNSRFSYNFNCISPQNISEYNIHLWNSFGVQLVKFQFPKLHKCALCAYKCHNLFEMAQRSKKRRKKPTWIFIVGWRYTMVPHFSIVSSLLHMSESYCTGVHCYYWWCTKISKLALFLKPNKWFFNFYLANMVWEYRNSYLFELHSPCK